MAGMNTPIKVTEIAFTAYPVTDMARARAFYEGLLNFQETVKWEHEGKHWIEYDVGASTLGISNMSPDKWKASPDGPAIAFEVEEFDEAITALKQAGVIFYIEAMDSGACRMAIVSDPDGNSIAIHKRNVPQGTGSE